MANTYELIASVTVGAGGASTIDFTSIPGTYADLILKCSARNTSGGVNGVYITLNSSTSSFSDKYLEGNGSSVGSGSIVRYIGTESASTQTANTFSNMEVYLPNYAGSNNKSFSADAVDENNATTAYATFNAGLWSNSAAITSISLAISPGVQNFAQYSTAYLYGVKNA